MHLGEQQKTAQILQPLQRTTETWVEVELANGFSHSPCPWLPATFDAIAWLGSLAFMGRKLNAHFQQVLDDDSIKSSLGHEIPAS